MSKKNECLGTTDLPSGIPASEYVNKVEQNSAGSDAGKKDHRRRLAKEAWNAYLNYEKPILTDIRRCLRLLIGTAVPEIDDLCATPEFYDVCADYLCRKHGMVDSDLAIPSEEVLRIFLMEICTQPSGLR